MRRDLDSNGDRTELDEVLADYMRRIDRGELVEQQSLMDAYPHLADELRAYFAEAAAVEHFAAAATANFTSQVTFHAALDVRCPDCHAPTKVEVDTALTDLTCLACGSRFSLVDQGKSSKRAPSLMKLGRFELLERLGVGGFGSVWKARDKELDRTVAIKIPRAGLMTGDEQEMFFREARACAQLRHPNIVSVHEVGRDGDNLYIVSDFVRGVTLGDWLTGQQLTSREAADLCAKIADALHHAHEQGVVHRDLKPANIMIDGDGQPHLMDFGLARRDVGEVTITMDGQVLGTPAYMSPEQAQGEGHSADRRSDVYSLGVILFRLLTGEPPFRGNARMIINQVINEPAPSPRKLNGNIHKDMETITLKCLEKEPAKRNATAKDLADELRRWLAGIPIHARPISRVEQSWRWARRNPRIAILSASVAALLVAVATLSTIGYASIRREKIKAVQSAARESALRRQARQTVDDYFTRVSQTKLLDAPGLQPLRKDLLELARSYHQELVEKGAGDVETLSDLAAAHFRVGEINGLLGDSANAIESFQQAAHVWESLLERRIDTPELKANLATAYVNLANLRGDFQEVKESIELCNKARQTWELLVREHPADHAFRLSLAQTVDQLANLQLRNGQFQDAEQSYQDAGAHYAPLMAQAAETVTVQRLFAVHLRDKARLYARIGNRKDARDTLVKASEILQSNLRSNPANLSCGRYLATVFSQLGELHAVANEPNDALNCLEQARTIQAALAEQNPAVGDIQLEYAQTLVQIIGLEVERQPSGQAPTELGPAKNILLELAKSRAHPTAMQQAVATLLLRLSRYELRCGNEAEAISSHATGMRLLAKPPHAPQSTDSVSQFIGDAQEEFAARLRNARHFDAAATHFEEAIRIRTLHLGETSRAVAKDLAQLALVQAALRNTDGYRRSCRSLLERFGGDTEPALMNLVAWTCILRADAFQDTSPIVMLAEKAVAVAPQNRSFLNTLGVALFRAGRNEEALEKLQLAMNASDEDSDVIDRLFVAMIHFKMERPDDARAIWRAVQKEITSLDSDIDRDNRLAENHARAIDAIERQIFSSEARLLLDPGGNQQ